MAGLGCPKDFAKTWRVRFPHKAPVLQRWRQVKTKRMEKRNLFTEKCPISHASLEALLWLSMSNHKICSLEMGTPLGYWMLSLKARQKGQSKEESRELKEDQKQAREIRGKIGEGHKVLLRRCNAPREKIMKNQRGESKSMPEQLARTFGNFCTKSQITNMPPRNENCYT